jgi:hypothetical protein
MALKFVVTKLDSLAGSRVAVSGLLIGEGGVDGINVTTVNRASPRSVHSGVVSHRFGNGALLHS